LARLIIEEAVMYIMAFYLVSSVIFSAGVFNTYLPGQCYNSTSFSLEPCDTTPAPSIWGNTNDWNETLEKYNQSSTNMANPGAMLDPTAVVKLVGFYVTFLLDIISSTMLYYVLLPFIGAQWAHVLTFVLNIMVVIVSIRVITGRIRWD
jgi:hypothetical protein